MGDGEGRRNESFSGSFGTRSRARARAATMIPGIEKRLTTVARITTQLLDLGEEGRRRRRRRRFPPSPCPYLAFSVRPDPGSTVTRERRRRRRRLNDDGGRGRTGRKGVSARSVKKFRRSESGQLLNLAVTKRTKEVGFNEGNQYRLSRLELLPPARGQETRGIARSPLSLSSSHNNVVRDEVDGAGRGITK